ncbi:MAG: restriction endonuclease [Ardenticatenaceae bacterium]|nr:restriction endonuclease [Ardenticatenaceae bacterium]
MTTFELVEYEPYLIPEAALPTAVGKQLWQDHGEKLAIEFPSPKTNQSWRLTSLGWAGHIPLSGGYQISIQPKIELRNLWRMWAYAYNLRSFHWLDGLANVESLAEFFEELAHVLAKKVLHRGRQGFYRAYLPQTERLPFVRGQLQWRQNCQQSNDAALICRHDIHTADIPDNQILAYTLERIVRSRRCSEVVNTAVSQAYRLLQSITTPQTFQPQDCINRTYTRLNDDYQPMHALCRFFLEHTGPGHASGSHEMLPFLVNMARLYELFVAEWLKANLPSPWFVKAQERVTIGAQDELQFDVDLVLYDGNACTEQSRSGRAHTVLDTKYKTPDKPANDDISQIVTYAKAKGCREAVLIYPVQLERPLNVTIGDIHLRSLTFTLDGDLEQAGHRFLDALNNFPGKSKVSGKTD